MRRVTVHKLNSAGASVIHYSGEIVDERPGEVCLVAHWERAALDLGYVRFDPGDRFVEWFYANRWYNIFEIHAGETDQLKGWYCNVAAPAQISADTIASQDLLLDLWVDPAGSMQVLDEDEFAADPYLNDAMRDAARAALGDLQTRVRTRTPPFDAIPRNPSGRSS